MTSDPATATAPSAATTTTTTVKEEAMSHSEKYHSVSDAADASNSNQSKQAAVLRLLGSHIVCTLRDGRKARGELVCVDRL
jgi:hypothetical protein